LYYPVVVHFIPQEHLSFIKLVSLSRPNFNCVVLSFFFVLHYVPCTLHVTICNCGSLHYKPWLLWDSFCNFWECICDLYSCCCHCCCNKQLTLLYSLALLYGSTEAVLNSLQRVQNNLARTVLHSGSCNSSESNLREMHWLLICERIRYKIANLWYRAERVGQPLYLTELVRD